MASAQGRNWWVRLFAGALALFAVLQLWRPTKTNPASDPALALEARVAVPPDVGALLDRSCADCHSNRSVWPWYADVAPVSWLVVEDVNSGRKHLNLSQLGKLDPERLGRKLKGMCREVTDGQMPLWQYTLIHRSAKVGPAEVQRLCDWADQAALQLGAAASAAPAKTPGGGQVPARPAPQGPPGAPGVGADAGSSGSIWPSPSR